MSDLDRPKYLVTAEVVFVHGTMYTHGAVVVSDAWPRSQDLQPLNESAKRIAAYWFKNQAQMFFPTAPYTHAHGFYLPSILHRFAPPRKRHVQDADGTELMTPPPDATPAMPHYRVKEFYADTLRQIGHKLIGPGETFAFLDWPTDSRIEPANDAARAVAAYLEANAGQPDLLSAPWCWYREAVYLPALKPLGRTVNTPEPLSPTTPIPTAARSGVSNNTGKRTPFLPAPARR